MQFFKIKNTHLFVLGHLNNFINTKKPNYSIKIWYKICRYKQFWTCQFLLLFINNQFLISSSHDLGEILVCMNCYKRNTVQAQDLVHSNNTSIIKPGKPKNQRIMFVTKSSINLNLYLLIVLCSSLRKTFKHKLDLVLEFTS